MRSPDEQERYLAHGRFVERNQVRLVYDRQLKLGILCIAIGAALMGALWLFNIGRDDGGPLVVIAALVSGAAGVLFWAWGLARHIKRPGR